MQDEFSLVSVSKSSELGFIRSYNYEWLETLNRDETEKLAKMLESIAVELRELNDKSQT